MTSPADVLDRRLSYDETRRWPPAWNAWHGSFSNFAPYPAIVVTTEGVLEGATGEHVFQAAKTADAGVRDLILAAPTPALARRMGQAPPRGIVADLRPAWEERIAVRVMRAIVRYKVATYPDVREALRDSGDRLIIEVTHHRDQRWGTDRNGIGANLLGQLWMEARAEVLHVG